MKKIILTFVSLTVVVTLAACGKDDNNNDEKNLEQPVENEEKDEQSKDEEKTETVTYEKKEDGVVVNVDLTHDGEELVRQVTTTTASYDDIEAENKEEAKEMFEEIGALDQFEDEKGLNYDVDFKEDHFVETLDVEYTKLSQERLNELARPADDNEEGQFTKVSYDLTVKDLEEAGFKKK